MLSILFLGEEAVSLAESEAFATVDPEVLCFLCCREALQWHNRQHAEAKLRWGAWDLVVLGADITPSEVQPTTAEGCPVLWSIAMKPRTGVTANACL
jgi:hypothetical protein